MSNKMLIDASHPEETRVVVVRGHKIEEFDFESEHKKQLKGNIYLARVTRVEPSLQAAFVEYGGNRHGFLAFSEIHPDYYQIPAADRLALLEEEEKAANDDNDLDYSHEENIQELKRSKKTKSKNLKDLASEDFEESISESLEIDNDDDNDQDNDHNDEENIEMVGAEDALEEVPRHQNNQRRQYKIQEVIKRRQILLVQVVKEERGNKGAALTTYLSLAGRYSVLMPNTARGGGISRKITNIQDRKRLKDIVKNLDVPKGMGVILRTAGANRTKAEVKRDYEYLMRLWENVRNLTLESVAPSLVYEEGSLIKRSIRDLYNKDINEILVSGDSGYREAKNFMRMLMPSHAKVVQPYRDPFPIFTRNGIETQLDRMLQPQVTLKSGGYLVINQTEALVAIDVNSGRSTKEHSIEETAFQTNLEAAEEVSRQLRLRDLAGLVVIDFIDMEEKRNVRAIEKKLKDCLKFDRARIQVGRISHFGLMEMSRQRIRASVLESTMQPCPHCGGTGHIRSDSSVALHVIRAIEEYLLRHPNFNIVVHTPVSTALYVLNHKRQVIGDLELRFGLTISIEADENIGSQHLSIHKGSPAEGTPIIPAPLPVLEDDIDEPKIELTTEIIEKTNTEETASKRKKKKRGKRNNRDDESSPNAHHAHNDDDIAVEDNKRRRRRGRRGGRRHRDNDFNRRHLPYAEPVGEFAIRALAEIKQARRKRHIPAAEPVGFTNVINIKIDQSDSVSPSVTVSKKRRQKTKKGFDTKLPEINENKGDLILNAAATVEGDTVKETSKPIAKRGRKPKIPSTLKTHDVSEKDLQQAKAEKEQNTQEIIEDDKIVKPAKKTRKTTVKRTKTAKTSVQNTSLSPIEENAEEPSQERKKNVRKSRTVKKTDSQNAKKIDDAKTSNEPILTSSSNEPDEVPKKAGWWQKKGFL
ncbi:Rne/Rng family ribonuclease [Bartonella tamiae]|uniref:Ribonuclease E n=1 Tax=Bartonella tamiae Th239 TaxID=1094558 RepID=J0QST3_9HYPH|nr:ribonuclease E/G [Bartonella tamiae]EJF88896.1 rne/Rng family ribonuclease [Bartonella tamiae Th239]EJF94854.1 rne/Rng family ribonuclease [Bartonella tamiae Th307]